MMAHSKFVLIVSTGLVQSDGCLIVVGDSYWMPMIFHGDGFLAE